MCYRIKDWQEHFENNRTKDLKKMSWVPFPNKHDGDGYTELLDHDDGPAHYGAWCALVQVASKCEPRGTLIRDTGKPHDSVTLARKTRIPEGVWNLAIPRLVSIGWVETCDNLALACGSSAAGNPPLQEGKGREGKGTEGKDKLNALALDISKELLLQTSTALDRKLVATPKTCQSHIAKLLKKEVTAGLIRLTIDWLCTDNLKREYKFDVLSGKSLHDKWDRIQSAMAKGDGNSKHQRRSMVPE